jgi:hypothetical protein
VSTGSIAEMEKDLISRYILILKTLQKKRKAFNSDFYRGYTNVNKIYTVDECHGNS